MRHFVLIAALAAAATPAFAQSVYVTGQVARVDHKVSFEEFSVSDDDTGALVAVGYRVTPNFAVEAGYAHLGKISRTEDGVNIYAKPTSVYGALVGTAVVSPAFSVSAKLGVARNNVKVGYSDAFGEESVKEHKTSVLFGIGAAYNVTPTVAVVAEYTHFGKVAEDDESGLSLKANALSAGVRFSF